MRPCPVLESHPAAQHVPIVLAELASFAFMIRALLKLPRFGSSDPALIELTAMRDMRSNNLVVSW
jgi:hypothetical protein